MVKVCIIWSSKLCKSLQEETDPGLHCLIKLNHAQIQRRGQGSEPPKKSQK